MHLKCICDFKRISSLFFCYIKERKIKQQEYILLDWPTNVWKNKKLILSEKYTTGQIIYILFLNREHLNKKHLSAGLKRAYIKYLTKT